MKYFKIADLTTGEEHFISSTLPNETPTHVMLSAHLDPKHKYQVTEVSARTYWGFPERTRDPDEDWEDYDDDCECYE